METAASRVLANPFNLPAIPRLPGVCVIGISGCSGSGKSSFAVNLASKLRCYQPPISIDEYFDEPKIVSTLNDNWETPEGIDILRFRQRLVDTMLGAQNRWQAEVRWQEYIL